MLASVENPGAAEASDEDLLSAHVDGDADAFGNLMRRHEDRVFAIALRMTGNRPDALDATQDAFVAAFRQARSFRGDAQFSTWMYRIAVNATYDLLRKRKRGPEGEPEMEDRVEDPARGDETAALRVDIVRALRALPADYREAVVMHDLGGIPYEEIARITKTRIGTVKSRISRGRRRLAELLEPEGRAPTSKGRDG